MNRITKISQEGINLIAKWEGIKLKPYLCSAGICTIGVGSTYYEDGTRVKLTDSPITKERALELFKNTLSTYEKGVDSFTRDDINQNQFDSLVSFAYNLGTQALKGSTLLKKVNINPNDPSIAKEFAKWTRAGGKVLKGLINRRADEATLYFKNNEIKISSNEKH
jgi:lysozyme